ncbi:uncharacterized protein [Asterias amurensis]|uniref:uncharacterized protein n=1 Tax=Asterias amurensis TaxID=7602 RepID=UPI003AB51F6A
MEDALAQKYDRIQQFATRDWLGPSSVSLSRLERLQANVYDMTPTSSKSLRPSSGSSSRKVYTELDTAPPLATKSHLATATAWGSNASIPELIKQQGERQSTRQTSNQGPRRPWSGRKVPPSPTHQQAQRRPSATESGKDTGDSSQRRLDAFINVKGAKYDPKSRPPSGRGSRQTTGTALAELMLGVEDLSRMDVESTLEEFIRNQPSPGKLDLARLSAAFGDHPSLIAPPPVPRGSPNPDDEEAYLEGEGVASEGGDNARQESPYREIFVNQPGVPQLLRRPTPEPVRLSMTIPGMGEDSEEEEDDADEQENWSDLDRSDNKSSPNRTQPDLELQSVTSEVLTQLDDAPGSPISPPYRDQPTPLNTDSQIRIVPTHSTETKNELDDGQKRDPFEKSRGKHSVHIAEERNVTIDITPRDILKPYIPRPPLEKRRPQSAVTNRNQNDSDPNDKSIASRTSSRPATARPKSSRPRVARVGVEYGDTVDHSHRENGAPAQLHMRRAEVETMMSRMELTDEESNDDARPVRQVSQSSLSKNYYELSREASSGNPQQGAVLTTKTIRLGESGLMEQKSVSVIKQASEPFRSALHRQDKSGKETEGKKLKSGSDEDSSQKTHSAVRRPMKATNSVKIASPGRPESRMGYRHGDTDVSTTPGEGAEGKAKPETIATARRVSTRPVSAPIKRRDAETSSGRKSPGKTGRRPHSAKPPTNMGTDGKSSAIVTTTPKKRFVDYKRNREAVKALRDGSLKKEKKFTKQVVAVEEPKPVFWYPKKPVSESSEEEPMVIPLSVQEQEMETMHRKLLERGVNVSAQTLARGLLPPTQRGYDDCVADLPQKTSLGLLNQPEAWLGNLFRKYKLAERALVRANDRMTLQAEMEAKRAARPPRSKKKKSTGKRKVKVKTR